MNFDRLKDHEYLMAPYTLDEARAHRIQREAADQQEEIVLEGTNFQDGSGDDTVMEDTQA